MIQIVMPMPEKCSDCIFCNDNCSCVASDYNGLGINVGCAYRTGRRDIRCPLKEMEEVVRCKDCKHGTDSHDGLNQWVCIKPNTSDFYHDADWFCADGERREGDA